MEAREQFKQGNPEHNVSVTKRERPLDQTLYEDAERRRRDLERMRVERDKTNDHPKEEVFHNANSDKYVLKRLERELQQLEQEMAHEEAEKQGEDQKDEVEQPKTLNYDKMCRAL
jgi:hypothetical protein